MGYYELTRRVQGIVGEVIRFLKQAFRGRDSRVERPVTQ
jgi:hypothetical protein